MSDDRVVQIGNNKYWYGPYNCLVPIHMVSCVSTDGVNHTFIDGKTTNVRTSALCSKDEWIYKYTYVHYGNLFYCVKNLDDFGSNNEDNSDNNSDNENNDGEYCSKCSCKSCKRRSDEEDIKEREYYNQIGRSEMYQPFQQYPGQPNSMGSQNVFSWAQNPVQMGPYPGQPNSMSPYPQNSSNIPPYFGYSNKMGMSTVIPTRSSSFGDFVEQKFTKKDDYNKSIGISKPTGLFPTPSFPIGVQSNPIVNVPPKTENLRFSDLMPQTELNKNKKAEMLNFPIGESEEPEYDILKTFVNDNIINTDNITFLYSLDLIDRSPYSMEIEKKVSELIWSDKFSEEELIIKPFKSPLLFENTIVYFIKKYHNLNDLKELLKNTPYKNYLETVFKKLIDDNFIFIYRKTLGIPNNDLLFKTKDITIRVEVPTEIETSTKYPDNCDIFRYKYNFNQLLSYMTIDYDRDSSKIPICLFASNSNFLGNTNYLDSLDHNNKKIYHLLNRDAYIYKFTSINGWTVIITPFPAKNNADIASSEKYLAFEKNSNYPTISHEDIQDKRLEKLMTVGEFFKKAIISSKNNYYLIDSFNKNDEYVFVKNYIDFLNTNQPKF